MPTYETFIGDKLRRIELTRTSERGFTARMENKELSIELSDDKPNLKKSFTIKIGDRTYGVELQRIERDKPVQIKVEEATFMAEVKTSALRTAVTAFAPAPILTPARRNVAKNQTAEGAVTAPMTGKIMSVRVKDGDQVKQNQVLCIIEAMKMENEIVAPRAGVVQGVNVSEGSSVSEGETLLIVA